ncbi:MAG TPA: hypothetical protein VK508_21295 [Cyclobacteriaceae bacterium]|nr:hypothetical protein [Cyclobacteriaceae bacterium]
MRFVCILIALLLFESCQESKDPSKPENWTVTTFAGSTKGLEDGPLATAKFKYPYSLAMASNGDVYVTDHENFCIRKISNGNVTTIAGTGQYGVGSGPAGTTSIQEPNGIVATGTGAIYFSTSSYIIKVENSETTIVAGGPAMQDGKGMEAGFINAAGMTLGNDNAIYIADQYNNAIRRMTLSDYDVTTIAGKIPNGQNPTTTGLTDGVGSEARFKRPVDICLAADGSFYVADEGNSLIRKISANHTVTTIAGVGGANAITVEASGRLFAISSGSMLVAVEDANVVPLYGGQNSHLLGGAGDVVIAPDGSLLICDGLNNRIARAVRN